jgi:transcriptional regulator with XRE-family HTH domain
MGSSTAAKIRARRGDSGLTQEQLAVAAGVTAKTLGNAERGQNPSIDTLWKLSRYFGCTVDDLLPDEEEIAA